MSLTTTRRGGLRHLVWIECAGCGATSPEEPHPEMAWAAARHLGWAVPPATYQGPWCPDCANGLFGAKP